MQSIRDYLCFTKNTFRFFHRYLRGSVLLYDKENRKAKAKEGLHWSSSKRDLQDFQLLAKPNNPTTKLLAG
ncbi:hypothetical protein KP79_PYT24227 [Mizuhopecten yessoensis]|uniref:Uncharacterized protein n=1 Tax=Mizuhopecten yessoensis TaxID=6573 RepID=A0A210Q0Y6_MIZYE|nr:hypothetical protein KP79_PYT24227 [Mizuhopecten yessoensis]